MFLAFSIRILVLLLAAPSAQPNPGLPQQSAQSQATPKTGSSPEQSTDSKPCPTSAPSASAKSANCTSGVSHKPKRQAPAGPDKSAPGEPTKTVVRNGGTSDAKVAISPGMSDQQASQKLENTNQLLSSTDANLKQIAPRQLNASQQDTVKQIKSFVDQAKVAASKGDVERAYNLASKANMLSADLVGPKR
ncbi:MAG TPA: hypothetical protein VEI99_08770 [Terriglobales bacterium]|nr:hypothetical protein [Terriglobales bacterium]